MSKKIALVVGGTGMAANGILPYLLNEKGDEFETVLVLALKVDEKTFSKRTNRSYVPLCVNLNSTDSIIEGLKAQGSPKITDVYWYAEANRPPKMANAVMMRRLLAAGEAAGPVLQALLSISPQSVHDQLYGTCAYIAGSGKNERNQLWIGSVLDALKSTNAPLQRFMLGCGGKAYGMHLGPSLWSGYTNPFVETAPRCPGPLCYFDAEDFVANRAKQDNFSWCSVRPSFIVGLCPELSPGTQSIGIALAVYALILKTRGLNLAFPGPIGPYTAKIQFSTSEKIAEVAEFATRQHSGTILNVTSCPAFSWSEIWDSVGEYFGVQAEGPRNEFAGVNSEIVAGPHARQIWAKIRKQHDLQNEPFEHVLNFDFLDKSFTAGYDSIFSSDLLRKLGFPQHRVFEGESAKKILFDYWDRLIADKLIPDPSAVISGIHSVVVENDLISTDDFVLKSAIKHQRKISEDIIGGNLMSLVSELAKIAEESKHSGELDEGYISA